VRTEKILAAVAVAGILSLAAWGQAAQNQPGQGQAGQQGMNGQKQYKDRGEYDLYDAITKDTNPTTRLQKLDEWKSKYPNTDFIEERRQLYLTTYVAANKPQDAINTANEILKNNPNDFTALYYVTLLTPSLNKNDADTLSSAEKAANGLLANLDTQFADAKKPASVSEADWKKTRTQTEAIAHKTLGWAAMQRKDWAKAEDEFSKSLQLNPASGDVSYWLGTSILGEKNPDKQPAALYEFARAAGYTGEGSLSEAGRKQVKDYLTKAYTTYHGSTDGLDQLIQQASSNPLPPADFKIASITDIEKAKIEQENAEAAANPQLALWKNIKDQLTGPNGQTYFESSMKGAKLPALTGKVVSMEPAVRPKTVVLAIENGTTPDATLNFQAALPGKVDPGTSLTFEGVPTAYTTSPFMVTFDVDKADLKGWTGTNPAPARRRPARR
jgi:tetratricopeptide (TPR) repeat protein